MPNCADNFPRVWHAMEYNKETVHDFLALDVAHEFAYDVMRAMLDGASPEKIYTMAEEYLLGPLEDELAEKEEEANSCSRCKGSGGGHGELACPVCGGSGKRRPWE